MGAAALIFALSLSYDKRGLKVAMPDPPLVGLRQGLILLARPVAARVPRPVHCAHAPTPGEFYPARGKMARLWRRAR